MLREERIIPALVIAKRTYVQHGAAERSYFKMCLLHVSANPGHPLGNNIHILGGTILLAMLTIH
jgi:hypothetical protein